MAGKTTNWIRIGQRRFKYSHNVSTEKKQEIEKRHDGSSHFLFRKCRHGEKYRMYISYGI